ncbi:DnaJ homolog subfamily B member 4-like protein [Drosera capensis]
MVVDYYDILKVTPSASDEELRRSYKRLVMKWHPDKNPPSSRPLAETKFKQICEAYDVLIDPKKRQIYDRYGEDGLRFAGGAGVGFEEAAETAEERRWVDGFEGVVGGKAKELEIVLACGLEELFGGCRKKMKISRTVLDNYGNPATVAEVLAVDVEPGWKKGTRITFPGKGHHEPGLMPGDIVFVIDVKPHPVFKRSGNDLIVNQKISLLEALTGKTLTITTLDGRDLTTDVSDIVKPGHEVVIVGEGMPLSKDPKKRGDLRIKFDVKFPSRLSAAQKSDLKRVLGRTS